MQIRQEMIKATEREVPAIVLENGAGCGGVVIVHGYGGSKEELLGLAWRVAHAGFNAVCIDLGGHGEHQALLDGKIYADVEAAVSWCRRFGKVAVIGHSLGGRLALLSTADYRIGLSPALGASFAEETREGLREFRSYRVRDGKKAGFLDVLEELPLWREKGEANELIIYAEREIEEIKAQCELLQKSDIRMIPAALHRDIFLHEEVYSKVGEQLKRWFGQAAE